MKNLSLTLFLIWSGLGLMAQQSIFFGPPQLVHADTFFNSNSILSIDFDDDGDLDIVTDQGGILSTSNGLVICENTGAGDFVMHDYIPFPGEDEFHFIVGLVSVDLDMDNDQDVVMLKGNNQDHQIWTYRNDGFGHFERSQVFFAPDGALSIKTADLDGDGTAEVILYYQFNYRVHRFTGDSSGMLSLAETIVLPTTGRLEFADLDQDGDTDIVSSSNSVNYWYENTGDWSAFNTHNIGTNPTAFIEAVEDMNHDGSMDLIMKMSNQSVSVAYNDGNQAFTAGPSIPLNLLGYVRLIDMDEDGFEDLVMDSNGDDIFWYRNDSTGIDPTPRLAGGNVNTGIWALHVADITNDGRDDLYGIIDAIPFVMPNSGAQTFEPTQYVVTSGVRTFVTNFADLDQDNAIDVLLGSTTTDNLYPNTPISWHRNLGNGQLAPEATIGTTRRFDNYGMKPENVLHGDVDMDGDDDIIAAIILPDSGFVNPLYEVVWYEQTSPGVFGPAQHIAYQLSMMGILAGDLEGDGDVDIISIVYNGVESIIFVRLENQGEGFLETTIFFTNDLYYTSQMGDMDGDGRMDIVFTDGLAIYVAQQDDQGEFSVMTLQIPIAGMHEFFELEDMEGDGDLDLLMAATLYDVPDTQKAIVYFVNEGLTQTFGRSIIYSAPAESPHLVPFLYEDLNGDGLKDLIRCDYYLEAILLFEQLSDSSFAPPRIVLEDIECFLSSTYLADINSDGFPDLLYGPDAFGNTFWYENLQSDEQLLKVEVFFDVNENGVRDTLEPGMTHQRISIQPDNTYLIGSADGIVVFYGDLDSSYTIGLETEEGWYVTSDSSSYFVTIGQQDSLYSFGVAPDSLFHDLSIALAGNPAWCISPVPTAILLSNSGTIIEQGTLELIIGPDLVFISSEPEEDELSGDTVRWSFDQLFPNQERRVDIDFDLADDAVLGDTAQLYSSVYLTGISGDPADTFSAVFGDVISCSYDPNDKQVQPLGVGPDHLTLIGEDLTFTIRFQNTGNAPAFNVKLLDTIDTALHLNSLRVISSSHPVQTTIDPALRLVTFNFPNIMLPDSLSDPEGSNGYVLYRIAHHDGIDEETIIANTASIYFDLNEPIVTNTTISTMVSAIGNEIPTITIQHGMGSLEAGLFPNPADKLAYFTFSEAPDFSYRLALLDIRGRLVFERKHCHGQQMMIPLTGLEAGMYILSISDQSTGNVLGSLSLLKQ